MSEKLIEVKGLTKYFSTKKGPLHAVDHVDFHIEKGETLGLVGESGCGKSTTGHMLVRLLDATSGEAIYKGRDILSLNRKELRKLRTEIQIVFQDPYASLDTRRTVYESIEEPLAINGMFPNKKEREEYVFELMNTVGLAPRLVNSYPHELDGGRRQRVGVARAIAVNPEFIVLDEPVSALDVSIQAQILNLLQKLQSEKSLTYLFISHNLSVVKHISDRVAVMYLGKIVEMAPTKELFSNPLHPYTKALLSAVPVPRVDVQRERIILEGDVPSPINPKPGCRFYGRCQARCEQCQQGDIPLKEVTPGHYVACVHEGN